jgi:hypothetical protein
VAREQRQQELRCFCARKPLLATYGVNKKGKLFVHVKVYKQTRLYGEVLVTDGTVQLHCRECLRWHTVVIRQPGRAVLEESTETPSIVTDAATPSMLAPTAPES